MITRQECSLFPLAAMDCTTSPPICSLIMVNTAPSTLLSTMMSSAPHLVTTVEVVPSIHTQCAVAQVVEGTKMF